MQVTRPLQLLGDSSVCAAAGGEVGVRAGSHGVLSRGGIDRIDARGLVTGREAGGMPGGACAEITDACGASRAPSRAGPGPTTVGTMSDDDRMAEQIAYYRARAPEYDSVYAERPDLRDVLNVVDEVPLSGDVLELACGTGQWTPALAARARSLTALDSAPETLAIARSRPGTEGVEFVQADVFGWQPRRRYDTVFFGFWISHVPPSRIAAFWDVVGAALAPGGRAVFVDEGPAEAGREGLETEVRQLRDGTRWEIVKLFHEPGALTADLAALGWAADVRERGTFIVGTAQPAVDRATQG